jgi:hypothetical protein
MYGELRCSVGVAEGKIPLGITWCSREDNIKKEPPGKELGAWTDLAQDRDEWLYLFNTKLRGSIQCGEILDERRSYQFLNTLLHTLCF